VNKDLGIAQTPEAWTMMLLLQDASELKSDQGAFMVILLPILIQKELLHLRMT
jgi:hypothetical protein